ncbi:MAG: hypothetical protein JW804_08105 [Sedimentisphaerales bacterium]|nr:hypothetical protein [Sedimentisphaerales bacterium]
MALLVIIGTVAVFAVIIIAAIEVKRVDKNKPSLLSGADKIEDNSQDK